MTVDYSIKFTDVIMILALIVGPIAAVWISDNRRKNDEIKNRRVHVFRTLMATRTTTLYANHIEALNLVEIEFFNHRRIMDSWQLYRNHLDDGEFIKRDVVSWDKERNKLLIDLLYEMSITLGYSFDKSKIQQGVYYPSGYQRIENENTEARTLWLEILQGKRQLPMKAEVYTSQPPSTPTKETLPQKPVEKNPPAPGG